MVLVIGMEGMVSLACLRYTRKYLTPVIYSVINPPHWCRHFPSNSHVIIFVTGDAGSFTWFRVFLGWFSFAFNDIIHCDKRNAWVLLVRPLSYKTSAVLWNYNLKCSTLQVLIILDEQKLRRCLACRCSNTQSFQSINNLGTENKSMHVVVATYMAKWAICVAITRQYIALPMLSNINHT